MPTVAVLAVLLLGQEMQDKFYSGPQKGEKTPGFKVMDLEGRERDMIAEWKGAPTLIVFVHEVSRPLAQLLRRVDDHAAKRSGLRALVVLLGADVNEKERYLPIFQGALKLKSMGAVSADGREGPGGYGLNREAATTVLLAKDDVIVANWAIRSPSDTDAPAIIKTIDELLGVQEAPKGDLEARLAALEKEVRELRALVERLIAAQPRRLQGEAPKDAKLNGLVRRLIRADAADEAAAAAMKEIDEYVKESAELTRQAVEGFRLVLELKYGTPAAQKLIREWLDARK